MKLETEQLLGTLEILIEPFSQAFVWDAEEQGEFNVWNLAIAQGFVSLTDVEVAIEHWQSVERWGTPTEKTDYEYAPPRNERKDGWNAEIEEKRRASYQQLSQLLKAELQDLQAFKLSVPPQLSNSCEWHHPDYYFYLLVGQTADENWLCLLPTVPDQVTYNWGNLLRKTNQIKSPDNKSLELLSRIKIILAELPHIQIYGYYYGGYNYTYQYEIVRSMSQEKASAIELALQSAGMLKLETESVYRSNGYNSQKLLNFLNTNLNNKVVCTLNFWDIGFTYEIGEAPTGDWLGVRYLLEFEYNP